MEDTIKIITIRRTHHIADGTFGTLDIDGVPFCQTIELPWKNNKSDVSCIPPGEFQANKIVSPKRQYEVFELQGVPNRSNIEIHIANSVYDIEGCIGIGRAFGVVETKDNGEIHGIQDSKVAFNVFMAKLVNDPSVKLVILEV